MKVQTISIIGADSFIAGKFIDFNKSLKELKLFSRKKTNNQIETVLDDFFEISYDDLNNSDVIINFSAIVHQPRIKDENLYYKINQDLPIYLATLAKKLNIKHFIQISTLSVYGEKYLINKDTLEEPNTIYGKSKLEADKALLSLQDENFQVSVIRPPLVYGGGKAPGNLLKLIKFAQKGVPLPFKGIHNTKYFIHVNNLVLAINHVINTRKAGIVIPADPQPVSLDTLTDLIKQNSLKKVRLFPIPLFLRKILKLIIPKMYKKLFGNLVVKSNLPPTIYDLNYSIELGIEEMVTSRKPDK